MACPSTNLVKSRDLSGHDKERRLAHRRTGPADGDEGNKIRDQRRQCPGSDPPPTWPPRFWRDQTR